MSSGFVIYIGERTELEEIAAVESSLASLGAQSIATDREAGTIRATLDWGTSSYDLGKLKSRLSDGGQAVVAVDTAAEPASVAVDSNYWNLGFTNMIRQTTKTAWGNWTLSPGVVPGAVGILSPSTGSFTPVAMIPGATIVNLQGSKAWAIESSSVRKTESEIEFKGGYLDPSSGTEVKVGLDVAWSFATAGSIVSNATISGQAWVDDFGILMAEQFEWLLARARSMGYASKDGIVQGFGLITHVQQCLGGINIGSLNESSSFSIKGSVDGINSMTGGGSASASVKGSYKETNQSSSFESHMWPVESNQAAPGERALSFQFATFHGKQIMPTWIQPLSGLRLVFDNAHGGTYIGRCYVDYSLPGVAERQQKSTTVPGGQVHTLDFPLEATDLSVKVDFAAGGDDYFVFPAPVASWLTGQCTIDLRGVWPWGSSAEIRQQ